MDRPAAPWTTTTVRGGLWIAIDTSVDFATVKLHTYKGPLLLAMASGRVVRTWDLMIHGGCCFPVCQDTTTAQILCRPDAETESPVTNGQPVSTSGQHPP